MPTMADAKQLAAVLADRDRCRDEVTVLRSRMQTCLAENNRLERQVADLRRVNAQLLAACRGSIAIYADLEMGPLDRAAAYGPDAEPMSEEECLAIRSNLDAAIAAAEAAGCGEPPAIKGETHHSMNLPGQKTFEQVNEW